MTALPHAVRAVRTVQAVWAACLLGLWLPAGAMGAAAPFVPPGPAAASASAAGEPPAGSPAGGSGAAGTPGLSGIRLGTPARALIDGQWLATGATVRGARLQAIHADAVHLRLPDGQLQRLALTPQVDLRRHATPAPPSSSARPARSNQAATP